MLYTDKMINDILNYSKNFIDRAMQNKCSSQELKEILYLAFAGLMSYYGEEFINEISAPFLTSNFIYSKESIRDMFTKSGNQGGLDIEHYEKTKHADLRAYVQKNYMIFGPTNVKIKTSVFLSENKDISFDEFLEEAVHEINHLVNSVKGNVARKNGSLVSRTGVNYSFLVGEKINEARILEESINVCQTSEIMQHILAFCDYNIDDPEFRCLIDKLRGAKREGRPDMGYDLVVPIIKPLWQAPHFNLLLKKRRVSGEIKMIREEFDSKTSEGSFIQLADTLDNIDVGTQSFMELGSNISKSLVLVRQYLNNSK